MRTHFKFLFGTDIRLTFPPGRDCLGRCNAGKCTTAGGRGAELLGLGELLQLAVGGRLNHDNVETSLRSCVQERGLGAQVFDLNLFSWAHWNICHTWWSLPHATA